MAAGSEVVLVTGAAGGIGAAIARRFADGGAYVVLADLDAAGAADQAQTLPDAEALALDITDEAAVAAAVEDVVGRLGRLDVLVNNAALCTDTAFDELDRRGWDADVSVTLTGTFLLCRAVLGPMVRAGGGRIVNVASVNGVAAYGNEAYSAAKAGVLSLTRSLAVEYGGAGVRVNAVVPGTIRTPAWDARLARDPHCLDAVARWYPLGRVGEPDDIAAAVEFLASPAASWITGVALPVDGGLLAGNKPMIDSIVIDRD